MKVETSAPSNIALIKYMGKTDAVSNQPINSSLSWTLDNLRTFVRITHRQDFSLDQWQPLQQEGLLSVSLSEKGQARYLKHFQFLKNEYGIKENFLLESANNFPSDCGLASSASSFAALTRAASEIFQKMKPEKEWGIKKLAELARQGSGSSCRSFFSPWALWSDEGVKGMELPFANLLHQVVVVENGRKQVSSSEAHRRVSSSLLFQGRPQRAELRLQQLMQAFRQQDWERAKDICWSEFWDMHALFETSESPFAYMSGESLKVLRDLAQVWSEKKDGPLITMDAGANVHLLYRMDQLKMANEIKIQLQKDYHVL